MKSALFLSSVLVGATLATPDMFKRARCNADNCARALTGTFRGTALPSARRADCASFQQCTVYPATVTSTTTVTTFPVTQTTVLTAATLTDVTTYTTILSTVATLTDLETVTLVSTEIDSVTNIVTITQTAVAGQKRAAASYSTSCPSSVPAYASACSGTTRFASACSCAGVTKAYSTVSTTPTSVVTVTQVGQTTITLTTTALETSSIAAISTVTALTTVDTTIVNVLTSTAIVAQTSTVIVQPPAPSGNAYCSNGQTVNGLGATCNAVGCSPVNIRIEGASETVFEGTVLTGPRDITTNSGGTHRCDGTNNGANPAPFANGISSIDTASSLCGFTYDGSYSNQFQDFFITRIGQSDSNTSGNQFWGILNNYAFTPAGGCQTEVLPTDELLWAFNAFNVNFFLRVQPTQTPVVATPGQSLTFTVEGADGNGNFQPISEASFAGQLSGSNGQVTFTAPTTPGTYRYKATRGDSIRSNAVTVVVQG